MLVDFNTNTWYVWTCTSIQKEEKKRTKLRADNNMKVSSSAQDFL